MPWTFYNANGQRLSSAATNISVLDIDGATDIGADIVDAALFIIDDGAGGTNRKTAASRIKTYIGAPVYGRVVRTAGNFTTTSTSLVDATSAEITLTTGAFPLFFSVSHMTRNTHQGVDGIFNVELDGSTLMFGTDGIGYAQAVAALNSMVGFSGQTAVLSAGSHTLKEQWRVASNTGTIVASSGQSAMFSAFEIR